MADNKAFPDVGLRAVIDMSNFDANSQRLLGIVSNINSSITNFAAKSVTGFSNVSGGVNGVASAFQRVEAIVAGIVIADVFRGIARAVSDMTTQTIDAVSTFQKLEIQLTTIAARNFAKENAIPVAQALKMVSGEAEQLLFWLGQTAVTTPFSVDTLASVFALAQAYGFTTAQAQKLVLSVGDFTSAMGLGDDVLKRIIYSMGQMVAAGRPTGREVRELANAFVPIGDIADRLGKQLGKTRGEILDMFTTGAISAKQFIAEFEKMVDEDFAGSMERMSRTLAAAQNNIGDFFKNLVGRNVLGPVADEIAGAIQDSLKTALNPESYRMAGAAGEALLFAYQRLSYELQQNLGPALNALGKMLGFTEMTSLSFASAITNIGVGIQFFIRGLSAGITGLTNFVQGIFDYFGTSFSELSANMFEWGGNIIIQFARGIAAAISVVIRAITMIATTITSMLQANSPPKILPDLPSWGTAAMNSYMEGWRSADFSVFNDIQGMIEKAIMSLKITGKEGNEEGLISKVIGSFEIIANATEQFRKFGQVSSDTLNQIANSAGFASDAIKSFVVKSFEVMNLQSISDAVKKVFDFKGVGQVSIFGGMVDSFKDIEDIAGKFGSDISDMIISYSRNAAKLIDVNKAIAESQKEINKVTEYYDAILSGLNAQLTKVENEQEDLSRVKIIDKTLTSKILTADERKRLELEKQQLMLTREIKSTQLKKTTEVDSLKAKLKIYEDEKKALDDKVEYEKEVLKTLTESRLEAAKAELSSIKSLIDAQIKMNDLLSRRFQIKLGAGSLKDLIDTDAFNAALTGAGIDLNKIKENWTTALNKLWLDVKTKVQAYVDEVLAPFFSLAKPFEELKTSWKNLFESPELTKVVGDLGKGLENAFKPFFTFWDQNGKKIADEIGKFVGGIATNLFGTNAVTGKSVFEILNESIQAIGEKLVEKGPAITQFFSDLSKLINENAIPRFKEFLKTLGTETIPALIDFAVSSGPKVLELLTFMVNNSETLLKIFIGLKALEILATVFGALSGIASIAGGFTIFGNSLASLTPLLAFIPTPVYILAGALAILGFTISNLGPAAMTTYSQLKTLQQIFLEKEWDKFSTKISETSSSAFTAAYQLQKLREEATNSAWKNISDNFIPLSTTLERLGKIVAFKWEEIFGGTTGSGGKTFVSPQTVLQQIGTIISTEWAKAIAPINERININWEEKVGGFIPITITLAKLGAIVQVEWKKIFGSNGIVEGIFKDIFGEDGILEDIHDNFNTRYEETIKEFFGENGSPMAILGEFSKLISGWWNGLWGPEGTIMVSWGIFQKSLYDGFILIFGPTGTLQTAWLSFKTQFGIAWNSVFGGMEIEGSLLNRFAGFLSSLAIFWKGVFSTDVTDPTSMLGIVVSWGKKVAIAAFDLGKNMIQGVIDGIGSLWGTLLGKIGELMGLVTKTATTKVRAESPSKVFFDIGQNIMQGLSGGILDTKMLPVQAMASVVRSLSMPVSLATSWSAGVGGGSTVVNNDNRVSMNMNPTYLQYASPVSIYSDVTAALGAIRR